MLLLQADKIKKYYAERLVLTLDSLRVYTGDKIGIVGLNGAGKTTLLNILSGDLKPDEGHVKRCCSPAYIRQFSDEKSCADAQAASEFHLTGKLHRENLSGGEQTRLRLANALSSENVLLFADEPTSNLDEKGIKLLEEKLQSQESLLIISHDRALLLKICNKILEVKDGAATLYDGGYAFYKERKTAETERKFFEYRQYTDEKSHLEQALCDRRQRAGKIKKTPSRMGNSEARLYKRAATEKQEKLNNAVKSLETRLRKLEVKDKPREDPNIHMDFSLTNPPENKIVLSAKNLCFGFDKNIIFKDAAFEIPRGSKTAVIGENGAGKTTLMNLIARGYDGIYRVPKLKIGYFYQDFSAIDDDKSVLDNVLRGSIQSESAARSLLAGLMFFGDDVFKPAGVLSGGEKIRLSLCCLLVSDCNALILDEPTNYLDIDSVEAVQTIIGSYEGTVLFVSHDRAFISALADRLLIVKDGGITTFNGNLTQYDESASLPAKQKELKTKKIMLQMRLAAIASQLCDNHIKNTEKEKLDTEYQNIVTQLNAL